METKSNVVKEAIAPPIVKNNIDTVNKTEKLQASKSKKAKSISNKSEKVKSLDESRSTQSTETEDTLKSVNESSSILSASLCVKITIIEKAKIKY